MRDAMPPRAAEPRARPRPTRAINTDVPVGRALRTWFAGARRDLPWRVVDPATGRRDAYRVLVSEVMLQQTQVARVLEKYPEFLRRFPDVRALAGAGEHQVLAAWTGLGYYRRSRNLHAAAKAIVARHGGQVPRDPEALRALPGIGRYTAGAVASLAFGLPEPVVDGNVSRVLLRLHGRALASDDPGALAWTWDRATALVRASEDDPGALNEAMMELGATLCTPRAPRCEQCPLRARCAARAAGAQESIPRPKARARQRRAWQIVLRIRGADGRVWLQRRPDRGLWAGLWQCPAEELTKAPRSPRRVATALGERLGLGTTAPRRAGMRFDFQTTACLVHFAVFDHAGPPVGAPGRWCTPAQARRLPMSSPMRRILALA